MDLANTLVAGCAHDYVADNEPATADRDQMNYRHAYHAGNFADVVKHAVLALVIERLKLKDAPFRVIDTHAGIGSYDLSAEPALKTSEWRGGIGQLLGPDAAPLPEELGALLHPYLSVVRAFNPPGALRRYPGSPRLARSLLRPQDRLVVNELHPEDAARLRGQFARDPQTRVLELDGWTALKSLLPPKERRGIVLVDPPFETEGELQRLATGLADAVGRFATGIYMLWYPIKDPVPIARLERQLVSAGHRRLMQVTLMLRQPRDAALLNGCGLWILNPPWQLDEALSRLLPLLAARLGDDEEAHGSARWITREQTMPHSTE